MMPIISRRDALILGGLSLALALFHCCATLLGHYGWFVDELYYLACTQRLDFGYVDHPPLSIAVLAAVRVVAGTSMFAVRLLPALVSGATVFLTGIVARQLGGSRAAMIAAALATIAHPIFLLMGSMYSMNVFEPLIVLAMLHLLIRMVQEDRPRLWIAIGALAGVGLEFKHTMALYVVAMVVGLLLTPRRRLLWNRWSALGAALCGVLVLPNILWQMSHGFPSLEFYRAISSGKNLDRGPLNIVLDQLLFTNPVTALLWIPGLALLWWRIDEGRQRHLMWTWVLLLALMMLSASSRPDRITAIYPVLFAAGSIALGLPRRRSQRIVLRAGIPALTLAGFLVFAPVVTPILSVEATKAHLAALGFSYSIEQGKAFSGLPQWLADRLGWRELADVVAGACSTLSPDELRHSAIICNNYGNAGALELFGPALGLPPVHCVHNSFHTWGPPADSITTFILVHIPRADADAVFDSVVVAGEHVCVDTTPPQQHITILIARHPRISIARNWPGFRIIG